MECGRCGNETEFSQSGICGKCFDEITDANGKAYTLREATKIIDDLKRRVEALEAMHVLKRMDETKIKRL